jgi:transposase-like protein
MRTVEHAADEFGGDRLEELPERVRDALGELAGAAKEGLLALSVGVGLGVLGELLESEVDEVVGPRGRHDPDRVAVRHGRDAGEVTLGGRRVAIERPRVRSADGSEEVALETYRHFAARDVLGRVVLERMLAGVSTRRYERTQEPVGAEADQAARSTSRSAISREFVARTRETLVELMSRRLDDVRLAVLMIDGIVLKERTTVVALGITTDGVKIPLGLWDGSTENATVATALLSDLVDRGLDLEQGVLCVLDGSKALRKAVRDVLGPVPVQRCVRHKERNVLEHLPERDRPPIKRRLRAAWALDDHDRAPGGRAGDAHAHPPGHPRRLHEPVRVDDRVRAPQRAQRQALAVRRDVPALDRRRHARSRAPVPPRHRPQRPRQARARRRARPPARPPRRQRSHVLDADRGGR